MRDGKEELTRGGGGGGGGRLFDTFGLGDRAY